jgi:hypothetical protein
MIFTCLSKVSFIYYSKLSDNLIRLFTTNALRKTIPRRTIIGEKSIPPKLIGILVRMGYRIGSVTL